MSHVSMIKHSWIGFYTILQT